MVAIRVNYIRNFVYENYGIKLPNLLSFSSLFSDLCYHISLFRTIEFARYENENNLSDKELPLRKY